MVKFLTTLFVMLFAPPETVIPFINPAVDVVELVVPFDKFAIVFPEIVTVPEPALMIPYTLC